MSEAEARLAAAGQPLLVGEQDRRRDEQDRHPDRALADQAPRQPGEELGMHARRAQHVDPEHAQAAFGAGNARVQVDDGARERDPGQARDLRVERLRKAGPPATHLEVGLARHGAHRGRELVDRGAVDQLHAESERDAERDPDHRQGRAPTLVREAGIQNEEQAQHGGAPTL